MISKVLTETSNFVYTKIVSVQSHIWNKNVFWGNKIINDHSNSICTLIVNDCHSMSFDVS